MGWELDYFRNRLARLDQEEALLFLRDTAFKSEEPDGGVGVQAVAEYVERISRSRIGELDDLFLYGLLNTGQRVEALRGICCKLHGPYPRPEPASLSSLSFSIKSDLLVEISKIDPDHDIVIFSVLALFALKAPRDPEVIAKVKENAEGWALYLIERSIQDMRSWIH